MKTWIIHGQWTRWPRRRVCLGPRLRRTLKTCLVRHRWSTSPSGVCRRRFGCYNNRTRNCSKSRRGSATNRTLLSARLLSGFSASRQANTAATARKRLKRQWRNSVRMNLGLPGIDPMRDSACCAYSLASFCFANSVRKACSFCVTNFMYPLGSTNGFAAPSLRSAYFSVSPK